MSIFDLFDKRAKFLKKEQHPLAERALHLYYGGDDRSYCYFCGATGSDDNDWDAFKTWILIGYLAVELTTLSFCRCTSIGLSMKIS